MFTQSISLRRRLFRLGPAAQPWLRSVLSSASLALTLLVASTQAADNPGAEASSPIRRAAPENDASPSLSSGTTSPRSEKELAREIFATMLKAPGVKPGNRPVHARGLVCEGIFAASGEGAELSRAAQFQKSSRPIAITVRFSDGATDPFVPDNSPGAGPRGMAIRFHLPHGGEADIVAMSHNGFVVGTGAEFLDLQKAIVATDRTQPHPWPIESFLGSHPRALRFVQENAIIPASFATESFFSNDSFVFVNSAGSRQTGRYKILPVNGAEHLGPSEAESRKPDFLVEDLKTRLRTSPVEFRIVAQLPNPGDRTDDPSLVWPEDRRTIELGTVRLTTVVHDNERAEQALAFDPTNLTDGIELSDDPLPALRSRVYALSVKNRQSQHSGAATAQP